MARDPDSYSKFDDIIRDVGITDEANPWTSGGLSCDFRLLDALISRSLERGVVQHTGDFAKAFDCWAAAELRRIGFPADSVWPRPEMPRVLTRELSLLIQTVTSGGSAKQSQQLREELASWLATHDRSPGIAPTEAKILGGVYRKQADVLISDWSTGVELMISSKSMLGSHGKNLRNRFEESFGDAVNLRQRFPLGAFGFLFVIDTAVPTNDFVFLKSMLRKLVDAAGYDATCLVLVDVERTSAVLELATHPVPDDLAPGRFFDVLVGRVLDRTPADRHPVVRQLRGLDVDESDVEA